MALSKLSILFISLTLIVGVFGVVNFVTDQWIKIVLSNGNYAPPIQAGQSSVLNPINNTIVFFGGENRERAINNKISRYDLVADSWFINDTTIKEHAAVPTPRWGHASVATPLNTMYVFGGRNHTTIFNDIYKYDMVADKWLYIAPGGTPPPPRYLHTGVMYMIRNQLVFFGGLEGVSVNSTTPSNSIYRYDFELDQWLDGPDNLTVMGIPPTPRYGHTTIITCTNQMVVFGGQEANVDGPTNSIHIYDLYSTTWLTLHINGSLPQGRAYHCAVPTNLNTMIVFGGQFKSGAATNQVWKFDLLKTAWEYVIPESADDGPIARYGQSCAATPFNTMMVFGGKKNTQDYLNDITKYNIVSAVLRSSSDGVVLVVLISLVGTLVVGLCFALDLQSERNEIERIETLEKLAEANKDVIQLRKLKSDRQKNVKDHQPLFEKF